MEKEQNKKVLVIADDIWHPVDVIRRGVEGLQQSDMQDCSFEIVCTAKDILTEEMIDEYPVLMICKGDCINAANSEPWFEEEVTEVGPRELRRYVENGGNLLVIHAGCDVNPEWLHQEERFTRPCREYIELIGCHFVSHPPRCTVQVSVTDGNHPYTRGVETFSQRDEQYCIAMVTDDVHYLLETSSEAGGRQIGGYVREIGQGKVVLYTPGHNLSVWLDPNWKRLLKNTLEDLFLCATMSKTMQEV